MSTPTWFCVSNGKISLSLHVQPGAKATQITGLHGEALKIRLLAPPVDGKANEALIDFLAKRLNLPKAALRIKNGQTSRRKIIEIEGTSAEHCLRLLPA